MNYGEMEARKMERAAALDARETALYRYWSGETLLYVGISHDAFVRAGQHAERSSWYRSADRVTIERFPTRSAAREAELAAIAGEAPMFNIEGTGRDTRPAHWKPRPLDRVVKTDPLAGVFGHEIGDNGVWRYQFVIDGRISKKLYLVSLFSAIDGHMTTREMWSFKRIRRCTLYSSQEEWRFQGEMQNRRAFR